LSLGEAIVKSLTFLLLAALLASSLEAQAAEAPIKPVTLNGHPALITPLDARGNIYNSIEFTGTEAEPALTFHMVEYGAGLNDVKCRAKLTFNLQGVALRAETPSCAKQEFTANYSAVNVQTKYFGLWAVPYLYFKGGGHDKYWAFEADSTYSRIKWTRDAALALEQPSEQTIPVLEFTKTAFQAFPQAVENFWKLRGDIVRPGAEAEFAKQAAAWRALTEKPALPDEVKNHRTLAEAYIQERDLAKAVEHYKAGLKAYPTWPQGWYNLALIDGDLGDYETAAREMGFYLELVPNAADAEAAKVKILLWKDKANK
jgi:hypothetical protein